MIPRLTLLESTFWRILPSEDETIESRWNKIAKLYNESKSNILTTDRAGAVNSLKAELEMLGKDLREYRDIVKCIDITDFAELYMMAKKSANKALHEAKNDFEDLGNGFKTIEKKIADISADIPHGFGENK